MMSAEAAVAVITDSARQEGTAWPCAFLAGPVDRDVDAVQRSGWPTASHRGSAAHSANPPTVVLISSRDARSYGPGGTDIRKIQSRGDARTRATSALRRCLTW